METNTLDIPVIQKSKIASKKKMEPVGSTCCTPKNGALACCTPSVTKDENNGACCAQPDDGAACCNKEMEH